MATPFTGFYFSYLRQQSRHACKSPKALLGWIWPPRQRKTELRSSSSIKYGNDHPSTGLTWILPGTRLSEVVNMSCLALDVSGDARITFPVPAPSGLVRMNCCLEDPEASTAVTIWIFCPVCWSVTIYKIQHGSPFAWPVFRPVYLHLKAVFQEVITRITAGLRYILPVVMGNLHCQPDWS